MTLKKLPLRSCIACRAKKAQKELIRIGVDQSTDKMYLHKGGGRGVYLCYDQKCLEQAKKRKSISRALKCADTRIDFSLIDKAISENKTKEEE